MGVQTSNIFPYYLNLSALTYYYNKLEFYIKTDKNYLFVIIRSETIANFKIGNCQNKVPKDYLLRWVYVVEKCTLKKKKK